jgi:hypothetical protein
MAAWHLSQNVSILDLLQQAAETGDVERRAQIDIQIRRTLARSDTPVTDALPANWLSAMKSGQLLERVFRATQAAVKLQQWRIKYGEYPANTSWLPFSLDGVGLKYERSQDTDGFVVIANQQTTGPPILVLGSGRKNRKNH